MMETSRLLAFIPALLIFGCAFASLVLLGRRRTRVSATFALLTMLGSLPVLVVWTLWSPFLAPFTFASVFGCMELARYLRRTRDDLPRWVPPVVAAHMSLALVVVGLSLT